MKHKSIFWRCWIWAAMHHPDFNLCEFRLKQAILQIKAFGFSPYHSELCGIRISIALPSIWFNIPFRIFEDFKKAMALQGVVIPYEVYDDVPF